MTAVRTQAAADHHAADLEADARGRHEHQQHVAHPRRQVAPQVAVGGRKAVGDGDRLTALALGHGDGRAALGDVVLDAPLPRAQGRRHRVRLGLSQLVILAVQLRGTQANRIKTSPRFVHFSFQPTQL